MDLLNLLHVFIKVAPYISSLLPNKTKLKFDQDFKACWSFCFELLRCWLSTWVIWAFGNVFVKRPSQFQDLHRWEVGIFQVVNYVLAGCKRRMFPSNILTATEKTHASNQMWGWHNLFIAQSSSPWSLNRVQKPKFPQLCPSLDPWTGREGQGREETQPAPVQLIETKTCCRRRRPPSHLG